MGLKFWPPPPTAVTPIVHLRNGDYCSSPLGVLIPDLAVVHATSPPFAGKLFLALILFYLLHAPPWSSCSGKCFFQVLLLLLILFLIFFVLITTGFRHRSPLPPPSPANPSPHHL
ncbi:hypothetical protein V6N11_034437 [Hibiscus sabdariffa]|uniref:Uncharacterized protein n=1 Tax=Hibiscus sabdariffa TaxID=183260 RepID=A0ABR2NMK3_9ROSI